jgi:DNA-binding transcriptional ArsR family regulator
MGRAGPPHAVATDISTYALRRLAIRTPIAIHLLSQARIPVIRCSCAPQLSVALACRAEASITDLAEKFNMTLTGMKKHVDVLEKAGLVITQKVGRVRTCKVGPHRLEEATAWLEKYRRLWAARFDELDRVIADLKQREKVDGCKKGE